MAREMRITRREEAYRRPGRPGLDARAPRRPVRAGARLVRRRRAPTRRRAASTTRATGSRSRTRDDAFADAADAVRPGRARCGSAACSTTDALSAAAAAASVCSCTARRGLPRACMLSSSASISRPSASRRAVVQLLAHLGEELLLLVAVVVLGLLAQHVQLGLERDVVAVQREQVRQQALDREVLLERLEQHVLVRARRAPPDRTPAPRRRCAGSARRRCRGSGCA